MVFDALKKFCEQTGFSKIYWVAFSGGLDSYVLLHQLAELRHSFPIQLRAIHINHGLSPHASLWAKHCAEISRTLNVEYLEKNIEVIAHPKKSLEAEAREKRYAIFANLLGVGDCLLTAHQENDQAETVLLQLLRGAGPKGLAAMPDIKPLGKGVHARPFLSCSRDEIKAYAEHNQLQWIEDESNIQTTFNRNFLRHKIFPILKERWPTVDSTLRRVALHCHEAEILLEEIAREDLKKVRGNSSHSLSLRALKKLNPVRQRNVIRIWLDELHFPIPQTVKMQHIQSDLLYSAPHKNPCVKWAHVELRRYRDDIFAMHELPSHDPTQVYSWDLKEPLMIPGIGLLKAKKEWNVGKVTVRFRQGGESMLIAGHHHSLKKIFQEKGILPWLRDRIPLVYVDDQLVYIFFSQTGQPF